MRVDPQITVITPAYNEYRHVGEAIDSVLAQTFGDFEYIIVDDGSCDRTVEVALRHAKDDPRVQVIKKSHGGAGSARNVALQIARGKYIAFLDADDRWHRDFLQSQLALLRSLNSDVAAVFARARVISDNGHVYLFRWQRAGSYDFDDMLVQSCPPRGGSSLLIKKAALEAIGGFAEKITVDDMDAWLRIQRYSEMPYFWGSSSYLVDIRMRFRMDRRDNMRRFNALEAALAEHSPHLRRYPAQMAFVRPAVFAYRACHDEFAERWGNVARTAGLRSLLADSYGLRLLAWRSLTPSQRRAMIRGSLRARGFVEQVLGVRD